MSYETFTIQQLRKKLIDGEVTSVELTRACLERIKATDDRINAFITLCEEQALAAAEEADKRLAAGTAPALTGILLQSRIF